MTSYNPPVASSDPNASYIDANASTGQRGSAPPAKSIENPQREIVNAIIDAQITPSNDDLTQLAQAIRRSVFIYAVDIGTQNNIVINPLKPLIAYVPGAAYEVRVAVLNTGATSINVSGLGNRPLVRMSGAQLQAGDLATGGIALVVYDGTQFQLLTSNAQVISEASLVHYGVDTGTPSALVVTVSPNVTSYSPGLMCEIAVKNANLAGGTTINIQGLGVVPLVRSGGASLSANDLLAGSLALIGFDGTNFELYNVLVTPSTASSIDQSLTGPLRPYFIAVNSATVAAPPGSPAIGDTYLIPPGSTGLWSGLDNQVSQWTGTDGWHTRTMPTQHMVGVGDTDDFLKRTAAGTWRSIFATIAECLAGISTTLAVTPAGLRRAASIVGPLRPYFIAVNSALVATPPGSPALGDTYLVPANPTGVWTGLTNYVVQWDGAQWLSRLYPPETYVGCSDTGDLMTKRGGGNTWRTAYASLQEALDGVSTITIINPADLAYVLAHLPGSGDDMYSNLLWYGCL